MRARRTAVGLLLAAALLWGGVTAGAAYDPNAGCGEMGDVLVDAVPASEASGEPFALEDYSTGLPELDETIREILTELGAAEMSRYRALICAFLYVAENYSYMDHEWDEYGFDGTADWTAHRALVFFQSGGGVCYDYASAFCVLARALGYEAYNVVGSVFGRDHGYVCIPQGDLFVLYDPELASVEPELYPDLTLFQFLDNGGDYRCFFWQ